MGGEPLDRSGGLNKVDSIAAILTGRNFSFGSCSEGTRKKVTELKTVLLYRFKTNVPIIPVAFDFGKKRINLEFQFYLLELSKVT
jgi:hypothetical protein